MFELILIAAGSAAVANRPPLEADCKPQVILSGVSNTREAPSPKRERQRSQPQQPNRGTRPCMILTGA